MRRRPLPPSFDLARARRAEVLGSPAAAVAGRRRPASPRPWRKGVHGRRRVGQGDSFWQFRPYVSGDPVNRIDWRQSARSGRQLPEGWLIRQTEWDAAQTVYLWRDGSASMGWRSRAVAVRQARPRRLAAAGARIVAAARRRAGRGDPAGARPVSGRFGLDRRAGGARPDPRRRPDLPPRYPLPRHAQVVLFGDFLSPLEGIQETIGRMSAVPVTGYLLQVLDPAETTLPYDGRVRFQGMQGERDALIPRVESIRDTYRDRLKRQQEGLAAICAAAGFGFGVHRTDHAPELALLSLYTALGVR